MACLERLQGGREGVAVRAIAAVEEDEHVVAAQRGDRGGAVGPLLAFEDFQRLGVDGPALQCRIELGRGPGHALRHIGEVGCTVHHLHLQLQVAPHVGLGRPHDRDVAQVFEGLLQPLEFHQLGRAGRICRFGWPCRDGLRAWRRGLLQRRVFVEVPAAPAVGPVGAGLDLPSGRGCFLGRGRDQRHCQCQDRQQPQVRVSGAAHHGVLTAATSAAGRRGSS